MLFALLQTVAVGAFAHASLIDTAPADGAMLRETPADVTLHFNEPVAPLVFKLALPNGAIQTLTQTVAVTDGIKIDLSGLPGIKAHGTYLLSWRVVSADGHPVGGALTYSIGVRSGAAATNANATTMHATDASSTTTSSQIAAIWLTRLGLYLVLFIGVGAVLFRVFMSTDSTEPASSLRWVTAVLAVGLVLLPFAVGLQGLDALALPWNALMTWAPWRTSLATAYGNTAWLMLMSLLTAILATFFSKSPGQIKAGIRSRTSSGICARISAVIALLLLGAALAASGHASSATPQWLARPTVFIHGVTIAIWAGSLLPLILLLRKSVAADRRIAVLLRFSRIIPWVLALLLISGTTLALLQLDGLASLWRTDYGRILSAKLILVLLLLIVAAINRYALTESVQRNDHRADRARIWMRRLIGAELGIVLLVLALATTWRFTPPPRALAAVHPAPVSVHMHGQQAMLDLTLTPQADRSLRAVLFVHATDFSPLNAQEVSLQFSNPALGIEPLQKDAHYGAGEGNWVVEPFALPAPGRWHVRVDVLISDFESTALEQDVDVMF